jgi:hypothetical protein
MRLYKQFEIAPRLFCHSPRQYLRVEERTRMVALSSVNPLNKINQAGMVDEFSEILLRLG